MRLFYVIAALVIATPVGASARPLEAPNAYDLFFGRRDVYEGRWCAHVNSGFDRVEEICTFDSFGACQRFLLNPNSGFCVQNPGYAGPPPRPSRKHKRRSHR